MVSLTKVRGMKIAELKVRLKDNITCVKSAINVWQYYICSAISIPKKEGHAVLKSAQQSPYSVPLSHNIGYSLTVTLSHHKRYCLTPWLLLSHTIPKNEAHALPKSAQQSPYRLHLFVRVCVHVRAYVYVYAFLYVIWCHNSVKRVKQECDKSACTLGHKSN
jgi:hypothetical protein